MTKQTKKHSVIRDWMRGGQTIVHDFRMLRQVLKNVLIVGVIFVVIYTISYGYYNTNQYNHYVARKYLLSLTLGGFFMGDNKTVFRLKNGKTISVSHKDIIRQKVIVKMSNKVIVTYKTGLYQSGAIFIIIIIIITFIIKQRGQKQRNDKFLRGGSLVESDQLKKNIRKKISHDIHLGNMPLLKNSEVKHIDIIGTTGAGKSVTFKYLIKCIRKCGDRAMIYSTSYEFIEGFYQNKDIILNPLDKRCPNWSIWAEAEKVYHYDNIAGAVIPEEQGDKNQPFWSNASRTLFANAARKMKDAGDYSTKKLLKQLLTVSQEEIAKVVKNTEAAALVKEGMESVALSIRAELSTNLKSFKFLRDSKEEEFSIRKWVQNEEHHQGECVFIARSSDQEDTLKSLISCWISIFADATLSLPEDSDRRFWLIIDELPSLNRLKVLETIRAEGRKYGICVVLGAQAYAQAEVIYGQKGAQALFGLSSTKLFLRQNDEKDAEWVSRQLGREEIKVTQEGLSMGANTIRDGVSINEQEKLKQLVLASEIMNLDDLEGYYKLPGRLPVAHFKQKYYKPPVIAKDFIESDHQDHIYMLEDIPDEKDKKKKTKKNRSPIKDGGELFNPDTHFSDVNINNPPEWPDETVSNNETNQQSGQPQQLHLGKSKQIEQSHKPTHRPKPQHKRGLI